MDSISTTIYFILNNAIIFDSFTDLPTLNTLNNYIYFKYTIYLTSYFGIYSSNKDLLPYLLLSKTSLVYSYY
jgi:hypothetical protein